MTNKIEIGQINGNVQTVKIGDTIGFKQDFEQRGRLVGTDGPWLKISVFNPDTGDLA